MVRIFKWLDKKCFPMITPKEYAEEALETSLRELLKAQDQLDYAVSVVEYRKAQIERLVIQTNNSDHYTHLLAGISTSQSRSNSIVAVRQD